MHKYRLKEIAKFNVNSLSKKFNFGSIAYLDTGNLTNGKISEYQYFDLKSDSIPSRARRLVKNNSILYSTVRPNQRHFGIIKTDNVPDNIVVSTGFAVIDVNETIADPNYVYYFLQQHEVVATLSAVAEQSVSAYPSIKASDIGNLEITLPDLVTQKKIAQILQSFDKKILVNEKINDNLEQLAKSYFQKLFIDNAHSNWTLGTISDLGTIVGGGTPSKSKPEYYSSNGVAWITPKDLSINKSKFISHGANDITELGLKNSSACVMPEGTVLFSSRAPIGYIAIASGKVTTNQGFKSVVPKPEIGTAFVYYFLKHNLPVIEAMASGSTFKEVSGSIMRNVPVVIPDAETLAKFSEFCGSIFLQQKILEEQNQSLANLRDTLLHKCMSGTLDVSKLNI